MGEGGSFTEFGPFDRTIEAKREVWENAVRAVMSMFADLSMTDRTFSSRCACAEAAPAALGRLFRAEDD